MLPPSAGFQVTINGRIWVTAEVPSLDAVQEFIVQTLRYSAEHGRAAGAVVNVALKSGTNDLHATLFEFPRNDKLDANGYFNNFFRDPRLPLRQNAFGASAGGRLATNKLFWLANYEAFRRRDINIAGVIVPTAVMRSGDFSGLPPISGPLALDGVGNRTPFAGNRIPPERISPIAAKLLTYYPQPIVTGEPMRNYQETLSSPSDRDPWGAKEIGSRTTRR